MNPREVGPVYALAVSAVRFQRELIECSKAGRCIHDHLARDCAAAAATRDAWNEVHHAWEYPADVPMSEVDAGCLAVWRAMNAVPECPKGLPGEVLSLRAIVGVVLASRVTP